MNVAQHMEAVARRLLGKPNTALSTKRMLRYGTNGSLAVNLDNGTWFDHEAGKGGGVIALIDRERKGVNGAAVEWLREELGIEMTTAKTKQRRIVAEYDYTDETGTLLFQVVRQEPKKFLQRRPDGHGGWTWKMDGVRRVPFHLPQVLEANSRSIHICEGEKAVLACEAKGLVATCSPGGAGKWRDEFAQFFRGADVVILPDNDKPGEKHAQDGAKNLRPVASRVRIVRLPGLSPKGDAWDFFKAGGTVEQLAELCEQSDAEQAKPNGADGAQTNAGSAEHPDESSDWKKCCICDPGTMKPFPILHNTLIAIAR